MKPAAYISKNGVLFKELPPDQMDLEPLYSEKTLTDEEIMGLWKPLPDTTTYNSDILNFARVILRKAQEK